MRTAALYPGTFDPITNGHIDIIKRARKLFDKIIISVAISDIKQPMFSIDQRVEMAKIATQEIDGVIVKSFSNLLVDFARSEDIFVIIRGLRAVSDFEYELQMGYTNTSLEQRVETVHLMPSLKNAFISSSVVRSIIKHGGDASHLYPIGINKVIKGEL